MSIVLKAAAFVSLLGGLVFFHELGHYLAAKFFKVKVLKFSVGFGPKLWGFRRGETEYQLAALPLGGYVLMAGQDPSMIVDPSDRGRTFLDQVPWKRAIISFAGPAVNLILPPIVFFGLFLTPQLKDPPLIGAVLPDEPAERAGVRAGDLVLSIDGERIPSFEEMRRAIEERAGREMKLVVRRKGEERTIVVTPSSELETSPIETVKKGKLGVIGGRLPAFVGVIPGTRAYEGGLRTFDRVVRIADRAVLSNVDLEQAIEAAGKEPLQITVLRSETLGPSVAPLGTTKTVTVTVPGGDAPLGIERSELYVRHVDPASPAWAAGLRPLDRISAIGGTSVGSGPRLSRILDLRWRAKQNALPLSIDRDGQRVEVLFEPKLVKRFDMAEGSLMLPEYGFELFSRAAIAESLPDADRVLVSYPPMESLKRAVGQLTMLVRGMTLAIAGLFTGRVSYETLGGPIMLFQLGAQAAEQGLADFFEMFALISINLGLVNLIPMPALDGFHIVVAGIETVSRRRLPTRVREIASYVGVVILLGLMVLALRNDVLRVLAN